MLKIIGSFIVFSLSLLSFLFSGASLMDESLKLVRMDQTKRFQILTKPLEIKIDMLVPWVILYISAFQSYAHSNSRS